MRSFTTFHHTRIHGIPCSVKVHITPPSRAPIPRGEWFPMEPDDPGECDVLEVYDRKGYKADWLHNLLTDEDLERIYKELSSGGHDEE